MRITASYFLSVLASTCLGVMALSSTTDAQQLRVQPTAFSVWLDFDKLASPNPPKVALPIWLESIQTQHSPIRAGEPEQTTFRIRLRRMGQLHSEIQMRVFFDDVPGNPPVVTAWSETGVLRYQSAPLGAGLDLPSSAVLTVPVEGVDYVDLTVPGTGRNVRGVFLASLRTLQTRAAVDFAPPTAVADPFDAPAAAAVAEDDLYLYGRVRAALEPGVVKLERGTGTDSASWDIQLDAPPLAALVTFEVLDVDIALPPEVSVNQRPLGGANLQLPDLADPGFRGDVRPLERDLRFRYTGWIRCQKLIPGSAFISGLNNVQLRLNNGSGPVAVRAVEVQLKHHWQDFDYTVTP